MKRFAFIAFHADRWPMRAQCRLLGVSPSGYYAWRQRPPAMVKQALSAWQVAAQRVFATRAGCYWQRRLRNLLRREGHTAGRQRLRGWLRASGLRALCTRALPRLTHRPWRPARWRDTFSRRVVGWHVSESLRTYLILNAFNWSVAVCQPPPSLLVHTDRGSHYTSEIFTTLLTRTQAIASLSRPGNPYDNALAESGWSTPKTELLPRGACFADLEEARLELAEYLDHYYNTQRLHSAPGYCTQFEIELHYR